MSILMSYSFLQVLLLLPRQTHAQWLSIIPTSTRRTKARIQQEVKTLNSGKVVIQNATRSLYCVVRPHNQECHSTAG